MRKFIELVYRNHQIDSSQNQGLLLFLLRFGLSDLSASSLPRPRRAHLAQRLRPLLRCPACLVRSRPHPRPNGNRPCLCRPPQVRRRLTRPSRNGRPRPEQTTPCGIGLRGWSFLKPWSWSGLAGDLIHKSATAIRLNLYERISPEKSVMLLFERVK